MLNTNTNNNNDNNNNNISANENQSVRCTVCFTNQNECLLQCFLKQKQSFEKFHFTVRRNSYITSKIETTEVKIFENFLQIHRFQNRLLPLTQCWDRHVFLPQVVTFGMFLTVKLVGGRFFSKQFFQGCSQFSFQTYKI